MQDEIDAILDILDNVIIIFEEGDVAIIDIVISLIVFLNTDIDVVLIDDFNVLHVLVNDIFVNLPYLLSKV
jgi:hypothetical protein